MIIKNESRSIKLRLHSHFIIKKDSVSKHYILKIKTFLILCIKIYKDTIICISGIDFTIFQSEVGMYAPLSIIGYLGFYTEQR
jgi:hypothetical protein